MDKILINLSLFSRKQKVFIFKEESDSVVDLQQFNMEDLPEKVLTLSQKYHINSIQISGSKNYGEKIAKDISIYEKIHYSTNNLKIEVI